MTEEEMREQITKLTEENKTMKENFNTVNSQLETKDKEIASLHGTVSELKQKNYDLFVKVQTPVELNIDEPKVKIPSMEEVINKLKGDK